MKYPTSEDVQLAYDEYAKALGFVVHSSNQLQETFSRLFWHLLGRPDLAITNAVWHSIVSDKTQRDMLRAALNGVPKHKWEARLPEGRKDLGWLISKANEYANLRNDAVHAPCNFTITDGVGEIAPAIGSLNQRARNLRTKDVIKEFELYSSAFGMLNLFTHHANLALGHNDHVWPDRPTLPTRDQSNYRA